MKTETRKVTYLENCKSKDWMDKNLKPQEQSGFIRDAVQDKIVYENKIRKDKKNDK